MDMDEFKKIIFETFEKERAEYHKAKAEAEASSFERGARLTFSILADEFNDLNMIGKVPKKYMDVLERVGKKVELVLSDLRR